MATPPSDATERLVQIVTLYLRAPVAWHEDGGPVLAFDPPLDASEQAVYDRLRAIVRSLIPAISPAEWETLEPDIAGLRQYQNLASPTLAQTVLAVKAQSRILRAILRD
jgi:hypothetical protein